MESKKKKVLCSTHKSLIPDFDVLSTVFVADTSKPQIKQLLCTCSYNKVYGRPCIHSLVVAKSFSPNWSYITHDDVGVRWLKSYYLYSLPEKVIPDQSLQKNMKQVFPTLQKHEIVGIHINNKCYEDVPIREQPIPSDYVQHEHVVKCTKYPDSNEVNDFDPFSSNFDGTLSQVTHIGTQMSSDDDNDDIVL